MELQSVCCGQFVPTTRLSASPLSSHQIVSSSRRVRRKMAEHYIRWKEKKIRFGNYANRYVIPGFPVCLHSSAMEAVSSASNSDPDAKLKPSSPTTNARVPAIGFNQVEPFRGKSGSVSFYGLTHHLIEEQKLASSPFKDATGSFVWVLAPIALISSLLLPQIFLGNVIEAVAKDEILSEILASLSSEAIFYAGLAAFLRLTDIVQRPYLQFSAKRWGLITGLRGYLTTAFFTMGLKVFAPLLATFVTWPVLGLPALVAVTPFLLGCAAQFAFEVYLDRHGSSCWPLVPIIFEVYRLYQLSKAAHFIEKLMFSMRGAPVNPELLERSGALVAMLVSFQVLGIVCLWSLITFLLRLFPSRPVAEKY